MGSMFVGASRNPGGGSGCKLPSIHSLDLYSPSPSYEVPGAMLQAPAPVLPVRVSGGTGAGIAGIGGARGVCAAGDRRLSGYAVPAGGVGGVGSRGNSIGTSMVAGLAFGTGVVGGYSHFSSFGGSGIAPAARGLSGAGYGLSAVAMEPSGAGTGAGAGAGTYDSNGSDSAGPFKSPMSLPSSSVSSSDGLATLCDAASSQPATGQTACRPITPDCLLTTESPAGDAEASPSHEKVEIGTIDDTMHVGSKGAKPRKKRQCPECKLYFSNLATHKSTHLKPTSRPHICKYCNRGFARPNDLFRHIKCHWKETGSDQGQFKCPYKAFESGNHCCHPSGIFSRCDTFKNHLKAIHFRYPNGTKKENRNKVSGNCRMCNKFFNNVDDWIVSHIEKDECTFGK